MLRQLFGKVPPVYRAINRLRSYRLHEPQIHIDYAFLGSWYGGWTIPVGALTRTSIVYSFGLGEDVSFDLALIERFGCVVHAFDPTPVAVGWLQTQSLPPQFVHHRVGLAERDGDMQFFAPGDSHSFSREPASAATTATATLSGSQAVLFGAAGNTVVSDVGLQDTVAGGVGAMTVGAGSGSSQLVVFGGTGPLAFIGGSGTATVTGGASGQITGGAGGLTFVAAASSGAMLSAGSGGATLFGAANAAVSLGGSAGATIFVAATGNETLNGAASGADNTLWSGSGHDVLVGGSGNDMLAGGAGSATLSGGGGANLFFVTDGHAGGALTITDFTSQDQAGLFGYGGAAASTALRGAASAGGNTTLTLSDNTQITFLGVSSAASLQGHVFST